MPFPDAKTLECVWPLDASLGEGPFWSDAENCLWFVDIFRQQIHAFEPNTATKRSWSAPGRVSFVLPEIDGSFLVGLPGAVARFRTEQNTFEILARLEESHPKNRLNDACIDSRGRLWFGTMDEDAQKNSAALYRWGSEPAPVQVDGGYCISNGPAFSPDGHHFYVTDTLDRLIYRFMVAEDGGLHGKMAFLRFQPSDGYPDGTTVDAEGCLWVAFFGGWSVQRFAPNGKPIGEVKLPCANVTKMAFGGAGLKTAFVTTARTGLSPQDLLEQPLAGGLFAFEAGVAGLPQAIATPKPSATAAEGKAAT
jgi:sugar lactone lactonase YvrE